MSRRVSPWITKPPLAVGQSVTREASTPSDGLSELSQPQLWVLGVVLYAGGDSVTTVLGVGFMGVSEGGPVVAPLIGQFGLAALFGAKLAVLGGSYVLWRGIRRPCRVGVPVAFVTVGLFATVWNLHVLASALLT